MENILNKHLFTMFAGHRNGSHAKRLLLGYLFMQDFEGKSREDKILS